MTFTSKSHFSITAFAVAATAFVVLHGSMLMGFEQLASKAPDSIEAGTRLVKTNVAPRTVTLDRVVISTRRV